MSIMRIPIVSALALASVVAGCTANEGDDAKIQEARLPVVDDQRDDLILTWFASGGAQTGTSVSDVPAEHRKEVRVQDPTIPPEEAVPSLVFIADLTKPGPGGKYKVAVVSRELYNDRRRVAAAMTAGAPGIGDVPPIRLGPDGKPQLIMYATTTCPVCVGARRWLLDEGIPYTEKDVGRDRVAAAELAQKGKAQGISTGGVPVFDIGGRLVPGFDKSIIKKLLASSTPAVQPAAPAPADPPPARPVAPISI
jgi:glutaredoxin 3